MATRNPCSPSSTPFLDTQALERLHISQQQQQQLGKLAAHGSSPERATGDASGRSGGSSDTPRCGELSAASTPRGGESRAARLARLRQERSLQRISSALKGAVEKEDPAERVAQAELLSILRQEVRSGALRTPPVPALPMPRHI